MIFLNVCKVGIEGLLELGSQDLLLVGLLAHCHSDTWESEGDQIFQVPRHPKVPSMIYVSAKTKFRQLVDVATSSHFGVDTATFDC